MNGGMTALGRILQVVGWLWVAAGILGPIVGYERVNFFPGLILVFVARAIRRQTAQRAPREAGEDVRQPAETPERMLNTERVSRTRPDPEPVIRYREAEEQMTLDEVDPPAPPQEGLLDRIVSVGRDEEVESVELESEPITGEGPRAPISSAEMIARAHRRWNRKP